MMCPVRGGRDQFFENEARNGKQDKVRDEKWETRRNSRQEIGEKWETRQNSRREMGVNGKRDETRYIIFQRKTRKTGKKLEKQGGKTKNNRKK